MSPETLTQEILDERMREHRKWNIPLHPDDAIKLAEGFNRVAYDDNVHFDCLFTRRMLAWGCVEQALGKTFP